MHRSLRRMGTLRCPRASQKLKKYLALSYETHAPVSVAIGYKTNLSFATAFRSLDYTPADLLTGKPA